MSGCEKLDEPVSILIPAWNSGTNLRRCMNSIKKQSYRNIEVIVVDNFSTDDTESVCTEFNAKLVRFKGERSAAKNRGLALCNGKFIVWIDSDMAIHQDLVSECSGLLSSGGMQALSVPEIDICNTYWGRVFAFGRKIESSRSIKFLMPRAFTTEILTRIGGWDSNIVAGEDEDLTSRIIENHGVIQSTNLPIYHNVLGLRARAWILKGIYYRKSLANLYIKHGRKRRPSGKFSYDLKELCRRSLKEPDLAVGFFLSLCITLVINTIYFYRN